MALDPGAPRALFALVDLHCTEGDYDACVPLLQDAIDDGKKEASDATTPAAASGHAAACVDLAKTASTGEALKLLRRAVHNGGAAAAYCALGRLFLGAPGLVPDPTAAAGFFNAGAPSSPTAAGFLSTGMAAPPT